jgi:hypothetical protein
MTSKIYGRRFELPVITDIDGLGDRAQLDLIELLAHAIGAIRIEVAEAVACNASWHHREELLVDISIIDRLD